MALAMSLPGGEINDLSGLTTEDPDIAKVKQISGVNIQVHHPPLELTINHAKYSVALEISFTLTLADWNSISIRSMVADYGKVYAIHMSGLSERHSRIKLRPGGGFTVFHITIIHPAPKTNAPPSLRSTPPRPKSKSIPYSLDGLVQIGDGEKSLSWQPV